MIKCNLEIEWIEITEACDSYDARLISFSKIVSESKMLVNGMDSNGFEVEKVSASAPELSEYLGTEGAANNITQLTPSDRNTTGTQPGTSTSNTWFPGDIENASWEQRQAAVSTNGTDDETTEQLANHTADETNNEKTEQTTHENTEQTANQDTEETANQSSDSEEGKADSSSSASDNADDNKGMHTSTSKPSNYNLMNVTNPICKLILQTYII